ncbi:MAG: hypothetical protein EA374_08405 [Acholeplasmatales bacterium]|nr:MAG: hypothetical protein EA374_08405 [Acholeplasmatales bacterium]
MKKIWYVCMFGLLILVLMACQENDERSSTLVAIRIDETTLAASYDVGTFSLEALQLILTDADGSTRTLSVTAAMVSSSDRDALASVGTHTVTIHYQGFSTMVVIHLIDTPLFQTLETLYDMGVAEGLIAESYEEWLDSIRGEAGRSITEAVIDAEGQLVLTFSDGDAINVGPVVGQAGVDGREVVLRVVQDRLEWRYVGETAWQLLMDFSVAEQVPLHTVTFASDGDVEIPLRSVRHGESLALPGAQRVGYFFKGWYTDETLTQPFTASTPIFDDLTLHAKWQWGGDYEIVNGRAHVTGGSMYYWHELVIPEKLDGFIVDRITEGAFERQSNIEKLVLPRSLTVIERHAFYYAENLRRVELPEDSLLSWIDEAAFKLTRVSAFPNAPNLNYLGDEAFRASSMMHFDFGANLISIGEYAFADCHSLRSVSWPRRVRTMQRGTFARTPALSTLLFPEDAQLETIESHAFEHTRVPFYLFPERLHTIENQAFYLSRNATIYLPERLEYIGRNAVISIQDSTLTLLVAASEKPEGWHPDWNPNNNPVTWGFTLDASEDFEKDITPEGIIITGYTGEAKNLVMPVSLLGLPVIGISDEAFQDQMTLETVFLPPQLEFIGQRAFDGAINLHQITLPESLMRIGAKAFKDTMLERMHIPVETNEMGSSVFEGVPNLIISTDHLVSGPLWAHDWNIEQAVVYYDARHTYQGLYYETLVRGADTVVTITGLNADLKKLTIPTTIHGHLVVEIADEAFIGDSQLEHIILPETLWRIGTRAFADMPNVKSIVFAEHTDLAIIDTEAFKGNTNLAMFLIPNTVTTLGARAFMDCDTLVLYAEASQRPFTWNFHWNIDHRPVTWGFARYGATEQFDYSVIGTTAGLSIRLDQYIALEADVVIPMQIDGLPVTHIGDFAFMLAPILESVTIPSSVIVIGAYAFADAADLETVSLLPGSQLKEIGAHAFAQAAALTEFFIPITVKTIGTHAFAGCYSVTLLVEATEAGRNWHTDWNPDGAKVQWGAHDPFPLFHG